MRFRVAYVLVSGRRLTRDDLGGWTRPRHPGRELLPVRRMGALARHFRPETDLRRIVRFRRHPLLLTLDGVVTFRLGQQRVAALLAVRRRAVRVIFRHALTMHIAQALAILSLLRAELTVDILDGFTLDGGRRRYRVWSRFRDGDDASAMQHRIAHVLRRRADQVLTVVTGLRVFLRFVRHVNRRLRINEIPAKA